MENQWNFSETFTATSHSQPLSRQNYSDAPRHWGSLDSADGNHVFIASRAPIPAFRTRAFVLGLIADLYDQPLCRTDRSRCAARAICRRNRRAEGSTTSVQKVDKCLANTSAIFTLRDIPASGADRVFDASNCVGGAPRKRIGLTVQHLDIVLMIFSSNNLFTWDFCHT